MTTPGGDNRQVQVSLTANTSQYQSGMGQAEKSTDGLIQKLDSLGRKVDSVIRKTAHGFINASVGGTLGIVAATEAANRLDIAFKNVAATSALTGQSVNSLKTNAMDLSKSIPVSTEAIGQLMGVVQNLGVQGTANITNFTKVALQLSAATNTPPGQLLTGLVQLSQTMGTSYSDLERYSSELVSLSKSMGVDSQGVLAFAQGIEAVAQQAGVTQAQVLSLAAAFSRVGADGPAGATLFNKVLSDITTSVATGSTQLNTYANLVKMTSANFKTLFQQNPAEAFTRIVEALHNQGPKAVSTLQDLGLESSRTIKIIDALTSSQANLGAALTSGQSAYDSNTALSKASAASYKSLSDAMERFRTAITNIVQTLGGPFLGVATKFVNTLTNIVNVAVAIATPFKGLIDVFGAVGSAVAGVGGAFLLASLALIKFNFVWKPLTSLPAKGLATGLLDGSLGREARAPFIVGKGTPNERSAGFSNATYRTSRLLMLGGRTGVNAAADAAGSLRDTMSSEEDIAKRAEEESFMTRMGGRRGLVRKSLMFPVKKFGWEAKEGLNTFLNPLTPENRNQDVNPLAMQSWGPKIARKFGFMKPTVASEDVTSTAAADAGSVGMAGKVYSKPRDARGRFVSTATAGGAAEGEARAAAKAAEREAATMAAASAAAAKGAGELGAGAGAAAGGLSSLVMPAILLGTAFVLGKSWFEKYNNAGEKFAQGLQSLGNNLQQSAGVQGTGYRFAPTLTGAAQGPAASVSFGADDYGTATSAAFKKQNKDAIFQLANTQNAAALKTAAQSEINQTISQQSGDPLSKSEQEIMRQQLIAAVGSKQAQATYKGLNIKGITALSSSQAADELAGVDYGNSDSKSGQSKFRLLADDANSAQSITGGPSASAQILNILQGVATALHSPNASQGPMEFGQNFKAFAKQFQDTYNKDRPKSEQINVAGSQGVNQFIQNLSKGNESAKALAASLTAASLAANVVAPALGKIAALAINNPLHAGGVAGPVGAIGNGYDLSDPSAANYSQAVLGITAIAGSSGPKNNGNLISGIGMDSQRSLEQEIASWTKYRNSLNDGSAAAAAATQQIGNLTSKLQSQIGATHDAASAASVYAGLASQMVAKDANNPAAQAADAPQEQAYIDSAESSYQQGVSQLRSYVGQVDSLHYQQKAEAHDHYIQLSHMERDYQRSTKEANYSYNISRISAQHDFAEQMRTEMYATATAMNPLTQIQSQYTEGATEGLLNTNNQNRLMAQQGSNLASLSKMGVSSDVVKVLGLDKTANAEQLQRFVTDLAQDPKLVQKWNASIKHRLSLANAIDSSPNNSTLVELKRSFNYTAQQSAIAFTHSMQQAQQSYDISLGDFQSAYQLATQRELANLEQQINETTSLANESITQLTKSAASTGITAMVNYANTVTTAGNNIQAAIQGVANAAQASLNLNGGSAGGGGSTIASGALADGGVSGNGGAVGNSSISGNIRTQIAPGHFENTQTTSYVTPGTGAVNGGRGQDNGGNASADYRPSDAFIKAHPSDPAYNRSIASAMLSKFGFGQDQMQYLIKLWNQESGWNQYADNGSSSAYGIPQSLPATKMATFGADWRTNPATQIAWGLNYIQGRYKNPAGAWAHEVANNWYGKGAIATGAQVVGVGESGPEAIIPLNSHGATFIAQVVAKAAANGVGNASMSMMGTSRHAQKVVYSGDVSNHYDASTNFSGPISVQAQDVNDMLRQLRTKQRLSALTMPPSSMARA